MTAIPEKTRQARRLLYLVERETAKPTASGLAEIHTATGPGEPARIDAIDTLDAMRIDINHAYWLVREQVPGMDRLQLIADLAHRLIDSKEVERSLDSAIARANRLLGQEHTQPRPVAFIECPQCREKALAVNPENGSTRCVECCDLVA